MYMYYAHVLLNYMYSTCVYMYMYICTYMYMYVQHISIF